MSLPPLREFVASARRSELAPGLTMLFGVVVALIWSGVSYGSYHGVTHASLRPTSWSVLPVDSLNSVVVTGAMTIFFFALGLELRRELAEPSRRRLIRPAVVVATSGMVGAALTMLVVGAVADDRVVRSAWGIPMATDVAFALGAMALAGVERNDPARFFLLTLAIADDALTTVVLVCTGRAHVHVWWLAGLGVVLLLAVASRQRFGVSRWVLTALLAWLTCTNAGVEPPLAGMLIGCLIPPSHEAAGRLERRSVELSTWIVLPLFAFVGVGVSWHGMTWTHSLWRYTGALTAARLIGKVVGVGLAVAGLKTLRTAVRLDGVGRLVAFSGLCAIGFTLPLLFADQLFASGDTPYRGATVVVLLGTSFTAGLGAILGLRRAKR